MKQKTLSVQSRQNSIAENRRHLRNSFEASFAIYTSGFFIVTFPNKLKIPISRYKFDEKHIFGEIVLFEAVGLS